jgi:hypothetical protein
MKRTLNSIALSIIVCLSACSTSDKFSVMKRKYKPGYYVEFRGNKKARSAVNLGSQSQSSINKTASNKETAAIAETIINAEKKSEKKYPLTASNDNNLKVSSASPKNNHRTTTLNTAVQENIQKHTSAKPSRFQKAIISKLSKKAKTKSYSSDADTMLIVEIIFCFIPILSLIAIYLKDGKSITLNFWVDLILYVTLIGWIIFGLLVVLDVVNLA